MGRAESRLRLVCSSRYTHPQTTTESCLSRRAHEREEMAEAGKPIPQASGALASAHALSRSANAESPRKLVGPRLPNGERPVPLAPRRLRGPVPLARHEASPTSSRPPSASHAEALYLQKQVQAQTAMVFVLEDGEQIRGCIEWFDRESIKVRNTVRTLIFKRAIKYLHKAADA